MYLTIQRTDRTWAAEVHRAPCVVVVPSEIPVRVPRPGRRGLCMQMFLHRRLQHHTRHHISPERATLSTKENNQPSHKHTLCSQRHNMYDGTARGSIS
jgi:hypothetical protein